MKISYLNFTSFYKNNLLFLLQLGLTSIYFITSFTCGAVRVII
ncbi:hypothetical protein MtrunA17_Chr2g0310891 [Medicago truncatula]|uniref:Transmembrane protein n=1 Tax=Medicago truncatula TaxID=3880 RepID=A0A396J8N9_MEDTR|nr:hypothetical protein MtrunA17_Chr2g0310891 [Medicago truncatula]